MLACWPYWCDGRPTMAYNGECSVLGCSRENVGNGTGLCAKHWRIEKREILDRMAREWKDGQ